MLRDLFRGAAGDNLGRAAGVPEPKIEATTQAITQPGSPLTSSMSRDLADGRPVEVEPVLADLASRGSAHGVRTPLLDLATMHLRVYNHRLGGHSVNPEPGPGRMTTPPAGPRGWSNLGEQPVVETPWFRLRQARVELPGGRQLDHYLLRVPPLTMTAMLDAENRVLLLWRHRFIPDSRGWELPSGIAAAGADLAATASRQALAESGWEALPAEGAEADFPVSATWRVFCVNQPDSPLPGEAGPGQARQRGWAVQSRPSDVTNGC